MRTYVGAKIHGVPVTDGHLEYNGSVSIDFRLMEAAEIEEYEQVHVVNLNNGERWITYALRQDDRGVSLNGGGARLGLPNDRLIIMSYVVGDDFEPAKVVFVNEHGDVIKKMEYAK